MWMLIDCDYENNLMNITVFDDVENVEDAKIALMIFIWTVVIFPERVGLSV